ncbi:MAG: STAS domain-containing protein [Candidatus Sulfotelmatobacter sp.]
MVPNRIRKRLSTSMQSTDTYGQPWPRQDSLAAFTELYKESKLKLSLEVRNCGDVIVVHCQGRIVYRDEALALSQMVGEFLQSGNKVVLELSGVNSIDSAGIGGLVLLHTRAHSRKADVKYANPSQLVRQLLGLTNLDSVLEIHPSLGDALAAFQPAEACADC